jgi:hypothetical protein
MDDHLVVEGEPGWKFLEYLPESDTIRARPILGWSICKTRGGDDEIMPPTAITPTGAACLGSHNQAFLSPDGKILYCDNPERWFGSLAEWIHFEQAELRKEHVAA